MKFRHKTEPSVSIINPEVGTAKFQNHLFETTDKKLVASLRKHPDVVEIKETKSDDDE